MRWPRCFTPEGWNWASMCSLSSLSPDEIRSRLGLEHETRPLVLVALGGEGLRGQLVPKPDVVQKYSLLATPPLPRNAEGVRFIDDALLEANGLAYHDLVHAVDAAILKPGYSTIAECAANRTLVALVPREGFAEAPVLEQWVYRNIPSVRLERDQFLAGQWGDALDELLDNGSSIEFPTEVNGAEVIATELLALLSLDSGPR